MNILLSGAVVAYKRPIDSSLWANICPALLFYLYMQEVFFLGKTFGMGSSPVHSAHTKASKCFCLVPGQWARTYDNYLYALLQTIGEMKFIMFRAIKIWWAAQSGQDISALDNKKIGVGWRKREIPPPPTPTSSQALVTEHDLSCWTYIDSFLLNKFASGHCYLSEGSIRHPKIKVQQQHQIRQNIALFILTCFVHSSPVQVANQNKLRFGV